MSNDEVLSIYELMVTLTNQMLEAVKQKDWDRMAELEKICKNCAQKIPKRDQPDLLSQEALERKVKSLKKILENDKEIRALLEPWMVRLTKLMHTNSQAVKPPDVLRR